MLSSDASDNRNNYHNLITFLLLLLILIIIVITNKCVYIYIYISIYISTYLCVYVCIYHVSLRACVDAQPSAVNSGFAARRLQTQAALCKPELTSDSELSGRWLNLSCRLFVFPSTKKTGCAGVGSMPSVSLCKHLVLECTWPLGRALNAMVMSSLVLY